MSLSSSVALFGPYGTIAPAPSHFRPGLERRDVADPFRRSTEEDTVLEDTIFRSRASLAECPANHPKYIDRCLELSRLLRLHTETTANDASREECIHINEEILNREAIDDKQRARARLNLAAVLHIRFRRTGDPHSLQYAIFLLRDILALSSTEDSDQASYLVEMATYLRDLYDLSGEPSVLNEAVVYDTQALSLRPTGHHHRDISCLSLAASLTLQFQLTGYYSLLEQIIELRKEALGLRPAGHPQRGAACTDLAKSLVAKFYKVEKPELLSEAHALYMEALKLYPVGDPTRWPLMIGLAQLYMNLRWPQHDSIQSINFLRQAIFADQENLPSLLATVAHVLGQYDLRQPSFVVVDLLLESYAAAIDLSVVVAGFVLDHTSQLRHLRTCRTLTSEAYYLASFVGKHKYGLALLERGRGVLWSRALHLRDPLLKDLPSKIASETKSLLHEMDLRLSPEPSLLDSQSIAQAPAKSKLTNRHQHNAQLLQLIQNIRAMSGFEDFMRGPGLGASLATRVGSPHPVVLLVAAHGACEALIIRDHGQSLAPVFLPEIKSSDLENMFVRPGPARLRGEMEEENDEGTGFSSRYMYSGGYRLGSNSVPRLALHHLWAAVVKPVINELGLQKDARELRPRVHWCPTGVFTFVPLHAAGIYSGKIDEQECCSDYMVSSYTPTLAALLRVQEQKRTFNTKQSKLVLVAAESSGLPRLPNVTPEVEAVAKIAREAGILVDDACLAQDESTATSVANHLRDASFAHISCHGVQDVHDALASGFCLSDGRLTVQKLMMTKHDIALLAFLSACETAKGDHVQPDQAVHLAAALLFTGFQNVVATMWAMRDSDGPTISRLFYKKLFETETVDGDKIAYALDHAVTGLRKSGALPYQWATFVHIGV